MTKDSTQRVIKILEDAKGLISKGHVKGSYGKKANGTLVDAVEDLDGCVCYCLVGAIKQSSKLNCGYIQHQEGAFKAVFDAIHKLNKTTSKETILDFRVGYKMLGESLKTLTAFSDKSNAEKVINIIDAAIKDIKP